VDTNQRAAGLALRAQDPLGLSEIAGRQRLEVQLGSGPSL